MEIHKFPYNWKLAEANFTKDKGKVFSCFACGGGSTMGYKLAGFDVIGCNEIDPKVNQVYVTNHAPRFNFLGDIRELRERERELPPELYNLDILDGSPPCSTFSLSGNREKDWGKDDFTKIPNGCAGIENLYPYMLDAANSGKITFERSIEDVAGEVAQFTGFSQAMTYSFESPKVFDKLLIPEDSDLRKAIPIMNPLGEDYSIMRTSSLNGMLTSLATN